MDRLTWQRALALTGVLWVALLILGNDVIGQAGDAPQPGDSLAEYSRYYADDITMRSWVAVGMEIAGMGFGLVFIAFAGTRLARAGFPCRLATVAGTAALAIKLGSGSALLAALYRADDGLDPQLLRLVSDVGGFAFVLSFLPLGLFAIGLAAAARELRAVPRWVWAWGIAAGALLPVGMPFAVNGPGSIAMLVFLLWTVVFSVSLAVRQELPQGVPLPELNGQPAAAG